MLTELTPLPYHQSIVDYLKKQEKELWLWFGSDDYHQDYKDNLVLELLKTTYRLNKETHQREYQLAKKAMVGLEIDLPLTLYQAQNQTEYNAALIYFEDEIAILISGDLFELLDDQELLALFAHELAHHKLYFNQNNDFFRASRILEWCEEQEDYNQSWTETARRYRLFTEIYADKGGFLVTKNTEAGISGLIKATTGLKKVDANAYLEQAEEVLDKVKAGSDENTHPEVFIRAKALDLYQQETLDLTQIKTLVCGKLSMHQLDICDQQQLITLTQDLFNLYGSQKLAQTEAVETHIKRFFSDFSGFKIPLEEKTNQLKKQLKTMDVSVLHYLSYVLLDLVTCELEREEIILAWSLRLSKNLGFFQQYEVIARKELKRKKADLVQLEKTTY